MNIWSYDIQLPNGDVFRSRKGWRSKKACVQGCVTQAKAHDIDLPDGVLELFKHPEVDELLIVTPSGDRFTLQVGFVEVEDT